jgi:hypothetical protein
MTVPSTPAPKYTEVPCEFRIDLGQQNHRIFYGVNPISTPSMGTGTLSSERPESVERLLQRIPTSALSGSTT